MKIREKYRNLNKWIRAAIMILLLAAFCASAFFIDAVRRDPNFFVRHFSGSLKLNKTKELSFRSDKKYLIGGGSFPVLAFRPEESGEYTITISDIKCDDSVYLKLMVMDRELSDYISEDNSDDPGSDLSGTALFSADTVYYVVIDAGDTEDRESFEGSFNITAAEAAEDEAPPEISAGETVRIKVSEDSRSAVVFRPEESAFYRFDTMLAGASDGGGFSGIASVTDENGKAQDLYESICYLEEGTEYQVWVDTEETKSLTTEVDVSCLKVGTETMKGGEKISIAGESVIEYTASASGPLAVWSVSDGDPHATVYDESGTPVSTDNDSGEAFSGNAKDLALVLNAVKGSRYFIYVGGDFSGCEINSGTYTGDGTSLGPDTVDAASEDESAEAETTEAESKEAENQ